MQYNKIFSLSPTLFLEIVRIRAGLTNCVLPQQLYESKFQIDLSNLVSAFLNGLVDAEKLERRISEVENRIKEELKSNEIREILNELDIDILPFCVVVNRILSSKHLPIFPEVQYYVYEMSKENKVRRGLKKTRKLEMKILRGENSLKNRMRIIKIEGGLLGYPKCCVDEFLRLKKKAILSNNFTPEKKIIIELLDIEVYNKLPKIFSNLSFEDFFYSLFTSNFYPCSIECKKAIKIGKMCEDYLEKYPEYKKAYRCRLFFNIFYQLVTGYKSYLLLKNANTEHSEYSKKVVNHFNSLKPDVEEILSAAKNVITDVKFGNEFIKKCMINL